MKAQLTLALLGALFAGCRNAPQTTRVYLSVSWDTTIPIDQLKVHLAGGDSIVAGPALRPSEPADQALEAPQTMRLIVPTGLAVKGNSFNVVIEAMYGKKVRGIGTVAVSLKKGEEISVDLEISRYIGDCEKCAGCCLDGVCTDATRDHCQADGKACISCGSRADTCTKGICACGDGATCQSGQICLAGTCACNADSCPDGCCDGEVCAPRSLATCGAPGATCNSCDSLISDNCTTTGACKCGETTCVTGQHCVGGSCVCDGVSCGGCCNGSSCLAGNSDSACGAGGGLCESCPGGQNCSQDGACANCRSYSCPDGCCSGSKCNAASTTTCGRRGGKCKTCSTVLADNCSYNGDCNCGASSQCGEEGQRCQDGACVCDTAKGFTNCGSNKVVCCSDKQKCNPDGGGTGVGQCL